MLDTTPIRKSLILIPQLAMRFFASRLLGLLDWNCKRRIWKNNKVLYIYCIRFLTFRWFRAKPFEFYPPNKCPPLLSQVDTTLHIGWEIRGVLGCSGNMLQQLGCNFPGVKWQIVDAADGQVSISQCWISKSYGDKDRLFWNSLHFSWSQPVLQCKKVTIRSISLT